MSEAPLPTSSVEVLGRKKAFHQSGQGNPIVLIHGNPTSSYLWRNVVPNLRQCGKVVVPDLIWMGGLRKAAERQCLHV
jgi:haloalkane dehalogenase